MVPQVKEVENVPALTQSDFPALPQIPDNTTFMCFQSQFGKAEKEAVAGIIITACIRSGNQWQAITAPTAMQILMDTGYFALMRQDVVNAVWAMYEEGMIEMVQVADMQYLVPTPKMAEIALAKGNRLHVVN